MTEQFSHCCHCETIIRDTAFTCTESTTDDVLLQATAGARGIKLKNGKVVCRSGNFQVNLVANTNCKDIY